MPEIASDGIQVIDVTDFPTRMGDPSLPGCPDNAKRERGRGLVRTRRGQSVVRRVRTNANAPATAARATAISDFVGLPPSAVGVAPRAFFLPMYLASCQTAQPIIALRRLNMATSFAYPRRRVCNRREGSGAGGRARPRMGRGHIPPTRRRSAEKLATIATPAQRAAV